MWQVSAAGMARTAVGCSAKASDEGAIWTDRLDQPSVLDSWVVRLTIDGSDTITLAGAIDGANGSPGWAVVRKRPGQP